jgi:ATP-dependent Clp protease ATP-binding subunit ClpA
MIVGRMTPQAREVVRLAYLESRELGHPVLADEHVLLGLLRHGEGRAASLLQRRGLDLDTARAELLRVGPALSSRVNPEHALRTFGIDVTELNDRLADTFGSDAVLLAQRRVRRRPRWRGGHPRPNALCLHSLTKRSFELAGRLADRRGDPGVGPEHLLYGILVDAADPLGTQLSRRSRRRLAALGLVDGRPNPLRLLLEARGVDMAQLRAELSQP